ncbi:SNF2 helicase associated domain-containing protein [Salipaludibacillus daqingensis]|uniref:DEAD/DEAH box helicase n=1 Tax=Salipaludibacillus daqingensis TaxID=3041001 RepID=UPI002476923C|nr:SNF2 helicase associated domain-containing protein [Salipaludibacillus daqingensis]
MNLNQLTNKDIHKNSASTSTYDKGNKYYEEEHVQDVVWSKNDRSFRAIVRGHEDYLVTVKATEGMLLTKSKCTCPAYETYEGFCKHIVATLFSVRDYFKNHKINTDFLSEGKTNTIVKIPYNERERTSKLLKSFEQLYVKKQETYHEREPLKVQYILKISSTFSERMRGSIELEMRIGRKRLYVVRNVSELLHAVEEEQALKFSKLFTYHPSDYYFEEEDIAIFRLMARLLDIKYAETYTFSYQYLRRSKDQDRSFDVPPAYAFDFLTQLEGRDVIVDDHTHEYQGFELQKEKPPLSFQIEDDVTDAGIYRLTWENAIHATYFGKKYGLLFLHGIFYKLEGNHLQAFDSLFFQIAMEDPSEMLIEEAQLESFASIVLPQLNEIGEVELSESIRENIQMSPLVPQLYVDYQADRVTAEVIFQYGEMKLSPFRQDATEGSQLIVRDMEKEYYLLSFIEDIPFKFNGTELYLEEMEDILDFVAEDVPKLSELFHLYATSALRNIVHQPEERPSVKVETNEKLNLLDVEFEIDGVSDEELSQVLESLLDNKKYYRLASGQYIHLKNQEFNGMKEMMEDLDMSSEETKQHAKLPLYRAFQLNETTEVQVKKDRAFKKLVERLTEPEELDFPIPEHLDDVLRDYQKRGFQWLMSLSYYGFGGILADDMGLGKTLQTITYLIASKMNHPEQGPALIICPSSVVYNWQKEMERFAPNLSTAVIAGPSSERKEAMEEAEKSDVWITSYPLIRRDIPHYQNRTFSTMVLDEAQYVKNEGTLTAKAVKMISSTRSFALSGTPIENSLEELYSIFSLVQPGMFKNKQVYKNMEEQKIAKRVKPFVLRRMKQDVLTELPDKIESVEYTPLTDKQKAVYLGQLQLLQNEATTAIQTDTLQQNRIKILAGITRLRQICCHPGMFMKEYDGGSGKLERLMEYLEEARDAGKRIVLFSQFTQMLSIMKERLHEGGWDYHYLDGSTPGKERLALSEKFNAGEKNLFLVSLKAGGTGLNLTGGDTVILFDSWWNPAVEEQAADRVYRFGQKRVVQVTKMITTGTIEEKIHKLQEKKRDLLDRVIQPGETMISSLGKDDIEELLDLKGGKEKLRNKTSQ